MSSAVVTNKKFGRKLTSITNHLLLTKTRNSLVHPSSSSTVVVKENLSQDTKSLHVHSPTEFNPIDNVATSMNFYQTLTNNLPSNSQNHLSSVVDNSSSFVNINNFKDEISRERSSAAEFTPMIYLCRFRQRNRLIEISITSEYYNQQHGISHEHLKDLIIQEFQLQQVIKPTLIIQIWNEQYQDYIDIESFKQIPFEGRLQVLIEKDTSPSRESSLLTSKSPPTPVSSHTITTTTTRAHSITSTPLQVTHDLGRTLSKSLRNTSLHDEADSSAQINFKIEKIDDESLNNVSTIQHYDNLTHPQQTLMYDLLPKPTSGIPIPRFPPHILAFLNGNGDANQLNALVQALYQEIVKYELYPNADELRSIVSRLVDRHPHCISVIGSVELLVRKLYYKFCNERKKYPIELKRRQPNKRKRLIRDEEISMMNNQQMYLGERQGTTSNDFHHSSLDRLMHLWTSTTNDLNYSSSPIANNPDDVHKYHPLNLSISMNNNNSNLMCTE